MLGGPLAIPALVLDIGAEFPGETVLELGRGESGWGDIVSPAGLGGAPGLRLNEELTGHVAGALRHSGLRSRVPRDMSRPHVA